MAEELLSRKHRTPLAFIKRYGRILLGGLIIAVILFCALFAPLITAFDPYERNFDLTKAAPGTMEFSVKRGKMMPHIWGTDVCGTDLFALVIYGARATVLVSLGVEFIRIVVGTVLGLICGYYTKAEKILMRILEAFNTVPGLLLNMVVASVLGNGAFKMMIAMAVTAIPGTARMIRTLVLSLREKEYIESEAAMGARPFRTMFVHILPACSSYLIVSFSTGLSGVILSMASLSYLGVGLDPSVPSWGNIIASGQMYLYTRPYMVTYAGLAICFAVFGFSMLGDGVRDLLDPKLNGGKS